MPKLRVRELLLLSFLNFLFLSSAFSQTTSKISGEVVDAITGDPLPGANVLIVGTSIGSSTDINGDYEIQGVPAGSYSVRVAYIGYDELISKADVKAGQNLTLNFKLKAVAIQSKEVVVTAQASGQNAAINQQLSSLQIANVVSAARIQELPDANAAESIARLPGVSVLRSGGEANEVVIRGLQPKYNEVTINGVEMAGSDPNDRSVDLSMISSTSLNGEEVTKTVTPDMDGNVLGGVVNFDLREAKVSPRGVPRFGLTAQGGYNGLTDAYRPYNNYEYVGSGEDRFLDDRLGVFVQASFERRNLPSNQLGASYDYIGRALEASDSTKPATVTLDDILSDRQRGNAVVTVDYKLPEGKILLANFFSSGVTKTQDEQQSFNVSTGNASWNFNAISSDSRVNTMTNLLTAEQQVGFLHAKMNLSHSYSETIDPNGYNVSFLYGSAFSPGLFSNKVNVDPTEVVKDASLNLSKTLLSTVSSNYTFTRQRDLVGSLDLDTHLSFSDEITAILKFGGRFEYQTRLYNYDALDGEAFGFASGTAEIALLKAEFPSWIKTPPGDNNNILMGPLLNSWNTYGTFLGGDYKLQNPLNFGHLDSMVSFMTTHQLSQNITYNTDIGGSAKSDYNGTEETSAGYVMATINIGPALTIIPGVRWQQLRSDYIALQGEQGNDPFNNYPNQADTVVAYHPYWLPDVLLRYKPTEWFDVRLAYTNTVSYPDYSSLAPIIVVNTTAATIQYNGFQLEPQRSTNYDAELSIYNNSVGLLTVGGFLKQLTNLIYQNTIFTSKSNLAANYFPNWVTKLPASNAVYSVTLYENNPYRVNDYGAEIDWETHFWYLPEPFTGLVLDANFTHIFSKAQYPTVTNIGTKTPIYVDTSYYSPLLYQPDDIANLTLGYDYKGFAIRVSYIYSARVFSQVNQTLPLAGYTSAYNRWDISVKQDLPFVNGVQLYCNLNNINGADERSVIASTYALPLSDYSYDYTIELGLRLNFDGLFNNMIE